MRILSGYRMMWMMVLYDLPVVTEAERKAATQFHKYLLDQGFHRGQLSVYLKHLDSASAVEAQKGRIEQGLPPGGKVDVLVFTDKQYENITRYERGTRGRRFKNPAQLELF